MKLTWQNAPISNEHKWQDQYNNYCNYLNVFVYGLISTNLETSLESNMAKWDPCTVSTPFGATETIRIREAMGSGVCAHELTCGGQEGDVEK